MVAFDEEAVRREARRLILEVLARKKAVVDPEKIREGVSLSVELGIDSLDVLQIMAIVEKKFGIRIPEEELPGMDDLDGIVRTVKKHWPAGA